MAALWSSVQCATTSLEATRWAAIVRRDPAAINSFVYCVRSTKIYCRPTCSARLPRRANVLTVETPAQAEEAGFRPCKRCRPELISYTPQDDKVQVACETICRYSLGPDNPRLSQLADEAGLTKYHFHRLFKKKTGLTPRQFADALRATDCGLPPSRPALGTEKAAGPMLSLEAHPQPVFSVEAQTSPEDELFAWTPSTGSDCFLTSPATWPDERDKSLFPDLT